MINLAGMSTMNAVCVLKDMKKDKLISEGNGQPEIVKFPALENISKNG